MTFEKADAALRNLRAAGTAEPNELDAIASFLRARFEGAAWEPKSTLALF